MKTMNGVGDFYRSKKRPLRVLCPHKKEYAQQRWADSIAPCGTGLAARKKFYSSARTGVIGVFIPRTILKSVGSLAQFTD
jgi:hypothetical protein